MFFLLFCSVLYPWFFFLALVGFSCISVLTRCGIYFELLGCFGGLAVGFEAAKQGYGSFGLAWTTGYWMVFWIFNFVRSFFFFFFFFFVLDVSKVGWVGSKIFHLHKIGMWLPSAPSAKQSIVQLTLQYWRDTYRLPSFLFCLLYLDFPKVGWAGRTLPFFLKTGMWTVRDEFWNLERTEIGYLVMGYRGEYTSDIVPRIGEWWSTTCLKGS